jgi:hypothetical protein
MGRLNNFGRVITLQNQGVLSSNVISLQGQGAKVIRHWNVSWLPVDPAIQNQKIIARAFVFAGVPHSDAPYYDAFNAGTPTLYPPGTNIEDANALRILVDSAFNEFGNYNLLTSPLVINEESVTLVQTQAYIPALSTSPGVVNYNMGGIMSAWGEIGGTTEQFAGYSLR